jgi:hypothetical protein
MFTYTTKTILAILLPISLLFSNSNMKCTQHDKNISLNNLTDTTKKGLNIGGSVFKILLGTLLSFGAIKPSYDFLRSDEGGFKNTVKDFFAGLKTCPFNTSADVNTYLNTVAPLAAGIILIKDGTKTLLKETNLCTDCE